MTDTLRLTAEEAMGLIERGEASGAELHRAYLDAAGERDGELHAYLTTVETAEGDGVPIALKDVISTKGIETTAGSKILAGYTPVFDSTVAARCMPELEAGAALGAWYTINGVSRSAAPLRGAARSTSRMT